MKNKRDLWLGLKAYRFENLVSPTLSSRISEVFGRQDASTLAFASKLARKYDWKPKFALRVVLEYKKFVFLGVTSQHSVTPSKIIDKVWHQHIEFTRGYREFCENVLGTNFDHTPELVPYDDQTAGFNAQYHETLERYRQEFRMEPPEDIWGTPKFNPRKVRADAKPRRHQQPAGADGGDELFLYQHFRSRLLEFSDSIHEPVGMTNADAVGNAGSPGADADGGSCSGGGCSS